MNERTEVHPPWCDRTHPRWSGHEVAMSNEIIDFVSLRVAVYSWSAPMVTLTRVIQAMDDRYLPIVGQVSEEHLAGMPAATARRVAARLIEAADVIEEIPGRRLTPNQAEADLRAFGDLTREQAETLWSMYQRRDELDELETETVLSRFDTPEDLRARHETDGAR